MGSNRYGSPDDSDDEPPPYRDSYYERPENDLDVAMSVYRKALNGVYILAVVVLVVIFLLKMLGAA